MPATSIFIKAASSGTSGIGNSRNSVLLGPVLTAASTVSATGGTPNCEVVGWGEMGSDPGSVKRVVFSRRAHRHEASIPRGAGSRPAGGDHVTAHEMPPSLKKAAVPRDALNRVKRWTRQRFDLPRDAPVFVSEVSCAVPG